MSVAITLWWGQETGVSSVFKTIIWFSKGVLLMSAANKWSSNSDKELAYCISILLTKVSKIINQYPRHNFTPSSTTTRGRLQIWAPQKLAKESYEDKLTIWNSQQNSFIIVCKLYAPLSFITKRLISLHTYMNKHSLPTCKNQSLSICQHTTG